MQIQVNGQPRQLEQALNLTELVELLGLKPDRCAIERNRALVSRAAWADTRVEENDQIEIVQFVGGG